MLSEYLKTLKNQRNLTNAQIGSMSGISESTVSRLLKGDAKSASIAAASIIAKVTRDRLMVQYEEVLPGYGFASNKGYGSGAHIQALKEQGPTPIHRETFIKNLI